MSLLQKFNNETSFKKGKEATCGLLFKWIHGGSVSLSRWARLLAMNFNTSREITAKFKEENNQVRC